MFTDSKRKVVGVLPVVWLLLAVWLAGSGWGQSGESKLEQIEKAAENGPGGTMEIPPQIFEQLMKYPPYQPPINPVLVRLSAAYRLLLVLLAGATLAGGFVLCRLLHDQKVLGQEKRGAFLVFGFFGSVAGLLIASAWLGSLYLHLAGIICVMISGFTIGAVLYTLCMKTPGRATPNSCL
jgi:hypothetical protein